MLADGLVDEVHCSCTRSRVVGPAALPRGRAAGKLSLAACESYENGVAYLAYRPEA